MVKDIHLSRPDAPGWRRSPTRFSSGSRKLAGADVDLYVGGELLATSKPELMASGLLGTGSARGWREGRGRAPFALNCTVNP
jgi:hypothetical protein